ncbi:Hypothetical protein, putative [Bodo saltans]|uniref:Uncharacterized protein n=1 Tax=Bodo saltans TaxID=75058 RepID=A0A0S4ILJ5_BODSA|nr:Hypothetical protein, putative [Bodo saltans]|eukprot:CUE70454.1 Hypothetical protein, putative [Bodo saltans]
MIPRAGRRASVAPQASTAIDPLEPPPVAAPSGPSWLDDDAPPQDLGATTIGTTPPAATFAPPKPTAAASWLDDDVPSRTMTPRAISPQAIIHAAPVQPPLAHTSASVPAVLPLQPSDILRARSSSPQSELGSQHARSATPQSSAGLAPSVTVTAQPQLISSSSPQYGLPTPSSPTPFSPSTQSRVDPQLRTPIHSGTSLPPSPPPAPVMVVFDDHASVLALLEKELEETNRATELVNESIQSLDVGAPHPHDVGAPHPHQLMVDIQQAATQANSAEAQLKLSVDAFSLMQSGFVDRRAALAMRRQAALDSITTTITTKTAQESEQQIRSLEVVIKAQSESIADLQKAVESAVNTIADGTQQSNQDAILELSSRMVSLFREDRAALKLRSKGILEEEARLVIMEATTERAAMIEVDRSARAKAVREHQELRNRRFETFRSRAKEDRQISADRLFGSLRVRMERLAGEAEARSKASLATFRERIAEEDVRTHREANSHVEQLLKRQHEDALTYERSCERSVTDLHQRLTALSSHERRMHDAALESANRLLNETIRSTTSDPSYDTHNILSTLKDAEGISVHHASLDHLHSIVHSLVEGVNEAAHMAAASIRRATESEVAKLIVERETVLNELGRETVSQKLRLDQDWKRLETGLLDLGAKADAFEKSSRQGRVMLTASQSRLEQVRATWEQEGRRNLQATIGAEGGGLLQDHPTTAVMFEIGCNISIFLDHYRRLKHQRYVQSQGVDAVDRELAQRREECASATMKILTLFESLGELSAKVELKQSTVQVETANVEAAKEDVRVQRASFESGVAMAKDVADRLRHVSSVVDEQQRKLDQQLYQRGYGWSNSHHHGAGSYPLGNGAGGQELYSIPPSQQNMATNRLLSAQQSKNGGGVLLPPARVTSSDSSSTSESKYRHLYEQPSSSHHHQRGGVAAGSSHQSSLRQQQQHHYAANQTAATQEEDSRNYSAAFQSLIPIDPTESFENDERGGTGHYRAGVARDTSVGTTHPDGEFSLRSNRTGGGGEYPHGSNTAAAGVWMRPANAAMMPRGSSESSNELHRGTGRSSLPTPSSDSGPPR